MGTASDLDAATAYPIMIRKQTLAGLSTVFYSYNLHLKH
jgi:hypothetical protein